MATAFSITKYRDPEKLDISALGKAMQYKQQMYDTNVAQTQQLVNQYAGTDLLRDVDKQYFGERLNTIVNYINESGTRDWSRRNVASDIQNYASNALDRNVMAAISSTQSYRKQMLEIEDFKKNKPDQYSMQNEWFATRDMERYMRENKIGDSYRAQSYTPYTDVKALLLENSKYLKDFGVEYHVDPIGGNQYFTKVGTFERIDPETAKEYLGMMMDAKVQGQLYIDGQYSFKDLPPANVKKQYDSRLNTYSNYNNERITELRTKALTATRDQKAQIEANIRKLEESNNNINKTKTMDLSKEAMADYLYKADFTDKWTDFLAYDKLKDWKIDESGFKMWEAEQKQQQQAWENGFAVKKFEYEQTKDLAKFQQDERKMAQDLTIAGWKRNDDGSISMDSNNPASGINVTDVPQEQTDVEAVDGFLNLEDTFNRNASVLNTSVVNEVKELLDKPENAELRKQLGGDKYNSKAAAWMMLHTPSKGNAVYALLSPESKSIVDTLKSTSMALKDVDKNLNSVTKDMSEMGRAMVSSSTKETTKQRFVTSSLGYTIDDKGNVVQGDVTKESGRNADLARTIAMYNYTLMGGDLSSTETAKLRRGLKNAVLTSNLTQAQQKAVLDKMQYKTGYNSGVGGFFKQATNEFTGEVLRSAQGFSNMLFNRDSSEKATFADDFKKEYLEGETFGSVGKLFLGMRQSFGTNSRVRDLGNSDVDKSKVSFDPSTLKTRIKEQLNAADKKVNNPTQTISKAMNIDMGSKGGKAMAGSFKAMLPVGSQIQEDGNVQIMVNPKTGLASVTVPVKDGKTYEPMTVQVPMTNLPQNLLNNIKTEEANNLYSASNPYSIKYEEKTEIPRDRSEWAAKINLMPANERTEAFNNPPVTQKDIIERVTAAYGSEIVEKNLSQINKIIDSPVDILTESKNGQWTLVAKQNGNPIYMEDTQKAVYNPSLMEKYSKDIVTEAVIEQIKNVLTSSASTTRR